jgi:predicted AlkP superfamily phosphohydrolase/phosphomutase
MERARRSPTRLRRHLAAALLVTIACAGAPDPPSRPKLIVIGIDGGDLQVLERRWNEGGLPHLRALADRGVVTALGTEWSKSPVIWTTIATGVAPEVHGIVDFVVPTPHGDVPVSSEVRRVPALWNLGSAAGLRVAVLGWWATWPAEEIDGVIVTDRAVPGDDATDDATEPLARRAHPASLDARLDGAIAAARDDPSLVLPRDGVGLRDRVMAHFARQLAAEDYDLVLVYFRSPDVVSHLRWKEFEPEAFGGAATPPGSPLDPVSEVYEQVDQAIGAIVAAAGPQADVLVVSDHGFKAQVPEQLQVALDLDRVLEQVGLLVRTADGGVDLERSAFYTYATRANRHAKLVRLGGRSGEDRDAAMRTLERSLSAVSWSGGETAFRVRGPRRRELDLGAELVVRVVAPPPGSDYRLLRQGDEVSGAVLSVSSLSGTHTSSTYGVLLAAGPRIDPRADLAGVRVHDLAPTILYALDLPVAEDFVGKARLDLFTEPLRAAQPLRTVTTHGTRAAGGVVVSPLDERILEELEALGYLP